MARSQAPQPEERVGYRAAVERVGKAVMQVPAPSPRARAASLHRSRTVALQVVLRAWLVKPGKTAQLLRPPQQAAASAKKGISLPKARRGRTGPRLVVEAEGEDCRALAVAVAVLALAAGKLVSPVARVARALCWYLLKAH